MNTKTKLIEKNGSSNPPPTSVWTRTFTSNSEWPDKVSMNECNLGCR